MQKIIWRFGIAGGIILAILGFINWELCFQMEVIPFSYGEVSGYGAMIIALITIFIAIVQYRDRYNNGVISFGQAFKIGILISLIVSAFYVISWMIISTIVMPDFMDRLAQKSLERMLYQHKSLEKISEQRKEFVRMNEMMKNPFISMGIAFIEIFPVGLIMTLIASFALKRKPK
jgi:hypothetical protein